MSTATATPTSPPLPAANFFDLVVIGSGPAALAVVARILESRPAALYTEDEHQHLHWLRRTEASKRPLLQTRKTGRGQERVVARQVGIARHDDGSNSTGKAGSSNACDCDGVMRILVIDRTGGWLGNWDRLFKAYRIPHLRSPMFFHPAPSDIEAMLAYAYRTGRTVTQLATDEQYLTSRRRSRCNKHEEACNSGICADLVEIPGCVGKEISKHKQKKNRGRKASAAADASMGPAVNERDRKDYFTPSTKLFRDFIQEDIIKRYGLDNDGRPWKSANDLFSKQQEAGDDSDLAESEQAPITLARGEVVDMHYGTLHIDGWDRLDGFCLDLGSGIHVGAKAAVCAIGPGAMPAIPDYLSGKRRRCTQKPMPVGPGWRHSTTIGNDGEPFPPAALCRRVKEGDKSASLVVIGGGLTSAQICDVAIRSGIPRVILIMRGYMKVKPFDFGLEWVGRYANLEKMRFWQEDDPEKRMQVMRRARNGGSITPLYAKLMRQYADAGRLQIRTNCTVQDARWTRGSTEDRDDGHWQLDLESRFDAKGKKICTAPATCPSEESCGEAPPAEVVHETIDAGYIVSATGAAPSFAKVPFLSQIAASEQVPEYGGLPWLSESLQYGKLPLFCTGAFSALQIGPGAFNLEGMRAAADRIAVRLQELAIGGSPTASPVLATSDLHHSADEVAKDSTADEETERLATHYSHFSFHHLPTEVET